MIGDKCGSRGCYLRRGVFLGLRLRRAITAAARAGFSLIGRLLGHAAGGRIAQIHVEFLDFDVLLGKPVAQGGQIFRALSSAVGSCRPHQVQRSLFMSWPRIKQASHTR